MVFTKLYGFFIVLLFFYLVLPDCIGFRSFLLGFTHFCRIVLGFTGSYRFFFTGLH